MSFDSPRSRMNGGVERAAKHTHSAMMAISTGWRVMNNHAAKRDERKSDRPDTHMNPGETE